MRFQTVALRRDPACPACGTREITALIDYDAFCDGSHHETSIPMDNDPPEITPLELDRRQRAGDPLDLIDVREPFEWDIARIPGARLIPLGDFPDAIASLDPARDIVIQCRSGVRSAEAARLLRASGFARVWNLAGGILRWSDDVDPTVPKY